jgi:hypothetical protein
MPRSGSCFLQKADLGVYDYRRLLGVCWTLRKRLAFDKHVDMYEGLGRAQSPRAALLTRGMCGEICQIRRCCAQHNHHSPITGSIDRVEVRHMSNAEELELSENRNALAVVKPKLAAPGLMQEWMQSTRLLTLSSTAYSLCPIRFSIELR